ncbi:MAG: CoA transferase [Xanthomonadales bacterium]|nr:CoA transferase [Xanthomonadales bacterium]
MSLAAGGALDGLLVVDLSRVLAGPLCTQMLADHGARVIKVEPPGGDETRRLGPPFDESGDAAYYSAINRGKEAISIDLRLAEGRAVLERLLARADVLVENNLPGTMARWGLGADEVLERHPRLIYCSISGFGADGPSGGLPGYDAVLQALCGLMSVNGHPATGATRVGIPLVDHLAGYVALSAILLALQVRERSGRGQHVEATLFDTALSLLVPHAANWLHSGATPQLLGSAHPNIAPYDKFAVADGEIFLGVVNDGQFRRFCSQIDQPELAQDPRFLTNRLRLQHLPALREAIKAVLRDRAGEPLCEALMRRGVPAAVVNSVPAALQLAHAQHRQSRVEAPGYAGLRSPMRLQGTPGQPGGAPPRFAQDRQAVLEWLGYDDSEVTELARTGAAPADRDGPA